MKTELKARLESAIQAFLDENADEIGGCEGIWHDNTMSGRNARIMANAAEVVIDAMALQNELEREYGDD